MLSSLKLCLVLGLCGALHTALVAGLVVLKAASSSDSFELDLHYNLTSGATIVSTHNDLRGKHLGHDRQDAVEIHPAKRSFLDRFWAIASNVLPKRWPSGGRNLRRPTKAEMKWLVRGDSVVVSPSCKRDAAPETEDASEAKALSKRLPPLAPDFEFDGDGFPNGGDYLLGGGEKRDVAATEQDTSEAELLSKRNPPLAHDFDFDSLPFKGGPGYLVGISKRDTEVSSPDDLLGGEEKRDVAATGDGDTSVNVNVIVQQGGEPCDGPECSAKPSVVVYTSAAGASMSDHTAAESPKSFVTLTTFVTASKETTSSPASTRLTSSGMSKVVKTILSTIEPESTPCPSTRASTTSTMPSSTISKVVKTILSTVEPESATPCPTITTSTKTSKIVKTMADTTKSCSTPSSGSTAIVTMSTLPTHITTAPGTVVVTMTTIPVPSSPSKTVKTIITTLEPSTTTSCASKTSASITAPTGGHPYPMKICEVDNIFGKLGLTESKWTPDDGSPGNKCPYKGPKPWKPAHHGWRCLVRSVASIFGRENSMENVTMEGRSEDAQSAPASDGKLFHSEPELGSDEHVLARDTLSRRGKPSKCPPGAKFIKLHPHCKTKSNCIDNATGTCLYPNGTSVHVPDPKHVQPLPVQSARPVSACAAPATVEQHIVPRDTLQDIPADPRCPPGATFTIMDTRCRRCPSSMGMPRCVYENGTVVATVARQRDSSKPAQTTVRDSPTPAPATAEQQILPRKALHEISADPRCPPGSTFTGPNNWCRRCPSFMGQSRCVYANGTTVSTSVI
ncbi:hypothetical protein B0A48_09262 [Cryoendolithus antarcticus]|uniref:Uncharacterized protein n=1 Tax=Cryoendolithus antarcticus TaxID=1507870 RepID=A0A1V8T231_9PEZI|nr:hypothetical protein B0A48_09262 [Cryoendolithus antarcticus]